MVRSISQKSENNIVYNSQGNMMLWLVIGMLIVGSLASFVYLKVTDMSQSKVTENLPSFAPSPEVSEIQQPSIIPVASLQPEISIKTDEEKCAESGGQWTTGPLSGNSFCNQKMADAGKSCLDSNECQSKHCYAKEATASSGVCGEYQSNFGCFYSFHQGKNLGMLCAD